MLRFEAKCDRLSKLRLELRSNPPGPSQVLHAPGRLAIGNGHCGSTESRSGTAKVFIASPSPGD